MKSITVTRVVRGPWMNAPAETSYVVKEVRNSSELAPGDTLTVRHFETLCRSPDWDVVTVRD